MNKIVTIDNEKGNKPISFVPYRQNFTWSVPAGDKLQFKASSGVSALYYLLSTNCELKKDFDPDPTPGGLVPYEVGKTIKGVVIDPNAKSVD